MKFKAVIFDMDGTLTVPTIDFRQIREELGIPEGNDLVKVIESRPSRKRDEAWALIRRHEVEAPVIIKDGVTGCLEKFRSRGIMLGILTRNSLESVSRLVNRLRFDFDIVLTREHEHIKPAPETVMYFLKKWRLSAAEVLVVGDYIHDIECAKNAGARSCFYFNQGSYFFGGEADFTVESFSGLEKLVLDE